MYNGHERPIRASTQLALSNHNHLFAPRHRLQEMRSTLPGPVQSLMCQMPAGDDHHMTHSMFVYVSKCLQICQLEIAERH